MEDESDSDNEEQAAQEAPKDRHESSSLPLYANATITLWMFVVILLDWQVRFGVSEAGMDELLLIFRAMLPKGNAVPRFKTAKRLMTDESIKPGSPLSVRATQQSLLQ